MGSPIDYSGICNAIQTTLSNDATLANYPVLIEEDFSWEQGDHPCIFIYFEGRTAANGQQRLSAGGLTRMELSFGIWVRAFSMASFKDAADQRNTALGLVEVATMRDHQFGIPTKIETSWLSGGTALSARGANAGSFISAAEIRLTVKAQSSTT